jgi:predicted O-linked N-acetylglucosamine transferase (SPINDLY family)
MSERTTSLFSEAAAAESRQDFDHAARLYEAILFEDPIELRARVRLAGVELARGRHAAAALHYRTAAQLRPDVPQLPYNEALALIAAQSLEASLIPLARSLAIDPNYAAAHLALVTTLRVLGRHEEAVQAASVAVKRKVDSADLAAQHGLALAATNQHEDAVSRFGDSFRLGGDKLEMRFQAGCSELALNNATAALAAFDGALSGRPDWIEAKINRAIALNALQRFEEALAICESLNATMRPDVLRTSGRALHGLKRLDDAIQRLLQALELNRDDHDAWEALTVIYAEANVSGPVLLHVIDEALRTWVGGTPARDATRVRMLSTRVGALYAVENMDEAEKCVDELMSLNPDFPLALGHQAFAHSANLDWSGFVERREKMIRGVRAAEPVTTPFQFLPQCDDPALQRQCAEYYMNLVHPPLSHKWSDSGVPSERIRIGYLSADFRDHPVSHLLAATLELHDRTRFEVFGFSSHLVVDAEPMSARIRAACDHFESLSGVSDEEAARRIAAANVDILVYLTGLTAGERPDILARRPAPVQVNFLGYPGTMGTKCVDYILADAAVIPTGFEQHYTEAVVRLPGSFLPPGDTRIASTSPGRAALGLPEDALVLAAFHSGFKLSPELFTVWMRLLAAQPRAVLWINLSSERARGRARSAAERANINPSRIIFAQRIPSRTDHLARLSEADLLLDTPIYNSHSSALDALWCNIPILTSRGDAFASRVCGSLLDLIGLGDTVATSLEDYEKIGLEWVTSPERLRALRMAVRDGIEAAQLFNCERHTRRLEVALQTMHARRLRGESPATLAVADPYSV